MKAESLEVWLNFRTDKKLQKDLDVRALGNGISRAEQARRFFRQGLKLPENTPTHFSLLLYERTYNEEGAQNIRETAIKIIEELFE